MTNITLSIENLPSDVNYSQVIIPQLLSGETAQLEGKIITKDTNGTFYPVFVISSGSIKNKEKFTLVIEKSEQNAGLAVFSGVSGLFGMFSFGEISIVVGLAIFLILLLLVIILVLVALSKSHRNEAWLGVEKV